MWCMQWCGQRLCRMSQQGLGPVCVEGVRLRLTVKSQPAKQVSEFALLEDFIADREDYRGTKGIFRFHLGGLGRSMTSVGDYTFQFKAVDSVARIKATTLSFSVTPGKGVGGWKACHHRGPCTNCHVMPVKEIRLGETCKDSLYLSQTDQYGNPKPFPQGLQLECKVTDRCQSSREVKIDAKYSVSLSEEGPFELEIKGITLTGKLDGIRPPYGACLIFQPAKDCMTMVNFEYPGNLSMKSGATYPIRALPGTGVRFWLDAGPCKDSHARVAGSTANVPQTLLKPKDTIEVLRIKGVDKDDNPIDSSEELSIELKQGLQWRSGSGGRRVYKAGSNGVIDLRDKIRVVGPLNTEAHFVVWNGSKVRVFEHTFKLAEGALKVHIPENTGFYPGSEVPGVEVTFCNVAGGCDNLEAGNLELRWMPGVLCPFEGGIAALPPIQLPRQPGLWRGRVTHRDHRELEATIEIQVLSLRATQMVCEQQPLMVACGVALHVPLTAVSDNGWPATLEWSGDCLLVAVEREGGGRAASILEAELTDIRAAEDPGAYMARLRMAGPAGRYILKKRPEEGEAALAAEAAGDGTRAAAPRLALAVILQAGRARMLTVSPEQVAVAHRAVLPVIVVRILDSWRNPCHQSRGTKFCVRWEEGLPCAGVVKAEFSDPTEQSRMESPFFSPSRSDANEEGAASPLLNGASSAATDAEAGEDGSCVLRGIVAAVPDPGAYQLHVWTRRPLGCGSSPLSTVVGVTVEAGRYASALQVLSPINLQRPLGAPQHATWIMYLEERPTLPCFKLAVIAADGKPLTPAHEEDIVLSGLEGGATYVAAYEPYEEGAVHRVCVLSNVPCPRVAGEYRLEFASANSTQASAVDPIIVKFYLRAGPPAALRLVDCPVPVQLRRGEGRQLSLEVMDHHGNRCVYEDGASRPNSLLCRQAMLFPQSWGWGPSAFSGCVGRRRWRWWKGGVT